MIHRSAFTIIELLVVIAIILTLASLVMAMMPAGADAQHRHDTKFLMAKIAKAIDTFVDEEGGVPLAAGSADDDISALAASITSATYNGVDAVLSADSWYPATNDGTWEKQQLLWRLGTAMTTDDKITMQDTAEFVHVLRDPYQSEKYNQERYDLMTSAGRDSFANMINPFMSSLLDKDGNVLTDAYFDTYHWKYYTSWDQVTTGSAWHPLGADFSIKAHGTAPMGHIKWTGRGFYKTHYMAMQGDISRDLAARRFLTRDCIDRDDIDERFIDEHTLLDSWGNPIIYIAKSTPAYSEVRYKNANGFERPFYVNAGGRRVIKDRNDDGTINVEDWSTQPPDDLEFIPDMNRNQVLDDYDRDALDDNGDGTVDENDWGSRLYYALPGRASSYFLGSAGKDGLFNCLPPANVNEDNVLHLEDYND